MLITYFLACACVILLPWRFFSFAYLVGLTLQTIPDPEMARAYLPVGKVSILDVSLLLTLGKIVAFHPKAMSALLGSPLARRVALLLGAYFAVSWLAGSRFGEQHMVQSLFSCLRLCAGAITMTIPILMIKTERDLLWALGGIVAFCVFNAAIIYLNAAGHSVGISLGEVQGMEREVQRFFGPVGDSITFILIFPFVAALALGRPFWAGFVLFAIGLTSSLGVYFALGAAGVAVLWLLPRLPRLRAFFDLRNAIFFLLSVAALISLIFVFNPFGNLIERLNSEMGDQFSMRQRFDTFGVALEIIRANPLFGSGFQGFFSIVGLNFMTGTEIVTGGLANANNQMLQTLCDGGVILLVLFLWFWVMVIKDVLEMDRLLPVYSTSRALLLAAGVWIASLLVGNQTAVWFLPGAVQTVIIWMLLGCLAAARQMCVMAGPVSPPCAKKAR